MNLLNFGKTKLPSVIKDPFDKNKITGIQVMFRYSFGKWQATGWLEFKNGDTKGEQKFEGESFDDVVSQIKKVIENL